MSIYKTNSEFTLKLSDGINQSTKLPFTFIDQKGKIIKLTCDEAEFVIRHLPLLIENYKKLI